MRHLKEGLIKQRGMVKPQEKFNKEFSDYCIIKTQYDYLIGIRGSIINKYFPNTVKANSENGLYFVHKYGLGIDLFNSIDWDHNLNYGGSLFSINNVEEIYTCTWDMTSVIKDIESKPVKMITNEELKKLTKSKHYTLTWKQS